MRRVFHTRAGWHRIALVVLLLALLAIFMWTKNIIPAVVVLVPLLCTIDRIIHTEYIIEDGRLTVGRGRYSKSRTVNTGSIRSVVRSRQALGTVSCIVVVTDEGTFTLTPENEDSFLKALANATAEAKRQNTNTEE